jgi:hypothetical protein
MCSIVHFARMDWPRLVLQAEWGIHPNPLIVNEF